MKLKYSYLCTDVQCDNVFYFDQLAISIFGHVPTCPTCGNKNNLSLFKILNRQEEKHETDDQRVFNRCHPVPSNKSFVIGPTSIIGGLTEKPIEDRSNQERSR